LKSEKEMSDQLKIELRKEGERGRNQTKEFEVILRNKEKEIEN